MSLQATDLQLLAYILLAFAGTLGPLAAFAGASRVGIAITGFSSTIAALLGIVSILRARGYI